MFVLNWDHPRHNKRGYVRRAWLVMEQKLGRYLRPGEIVHHENEDTLDDSPRNLKLWSSKPHHSHHAKGRKNPAFRRDIDTERDILTLRSLGFSKPRIAAMLNCSLATIKRRLRQKTKNPQHP